MLNICWEMCIAILAICFVATASNEEISSSLG
jgi:hypothetical protein